MEKALVEEGGGSAGLTSDMKKKIRLVEEYEKRLMICWEN